MSLGLGSDQTFCNLQLDHILQFTIIVKNAAQHVQAVFFRAGQDQVQAFAVRHGSRGRNDHFRRERHGGAPDCAAQRNGHESRAQLHHHHDLGAHTE